MAAVEHRARAMTVGHIAEQRLPPHGRELLPVQAVISNQRRAKQRSPDVGHAIEYRREVRPENLPEPRVVPEHAFERLADQAGIDVRVVEPLRQAMDLAS